MSGVLHKRMSNRILTTNHQVALVVSRWHEDITESLYQGAWNTLDQAGFRQDNIIRVDVPGSFELPLGVLREIKKSTVAGAIALGCLIEGETPHFHFIAQAVAHGLMNVSIETGKPVSFGIITANNISQAHDRSGGKWGNKGEEAAGTLLQMLP